MSAHPDRSHYPQATTDDQHPDRVPASPSLPDLERRVLAYWKDDDTFRASVEQRPAERDADGSGGEFVFYDGPPFANGLPHYGHLLTGYVKDVVPRYQTMRGRRVERRFGWDTHGLPAELEAMRQLGLKTTDEIRELGVAEFNAACRSSVLRYTDEWRDYVTRQARWVDFDHDYKTLEPDYMESVIWAFKTLYDKGLVYEGFRVLPYCWNDQTPLSSHELRMDDDVYQMRQDPAVTVGLRLETGELALVWTTTPWTLPSNLAIVVGPDIDYVVVESSATGTPERYVLAEARLEAYARELLDEGRESVAEQVVERLTGADLLGRAYTPPFGYYLGHANAFRVVEGDFVTTTDGTGLVHTAGAFGEDDKEVTDREGIEAVMPVGKDGRFTDPVDEYAGMLVFDANLPIIDALKAATRGQRDAAGSVTEGTVLLRRETYDHSYPHCWRCREPLIYKGVSSWFVEVTKVKDRMIELNQQIEWTPEHIRDGQFGKWLANARDWSITRNRFWGSPVPVWKSDDEAYPRIDVYGSFAELEADFGVEVTDLHRPYVDDLTRPNPDDPTGRSTMRRVPDVLDVWFDSGSMSFAQVHYPFENADWFESHFPGDFITEYVGQTRGWFYTLHVLATALFDRPAFSTCICHGIVLGSDGQKMSKSLRNYPDVQEVFDRDGADAMRWFLMSSPVVRGGDLVVTEQGIREGVRQVVLPLWNTWSFLAMYANARQGETRAPQWSTASEHVLDRYVLAKLADVVETTTAQLDAYEIGAACETVRGFMDVLTNWYVRRSRERFWDTGVEGDVGTDDGAGSTVDAAFDTLHTVLEVLTRVAAPLLPLTTEEVWRGLTGGRSVHLTDWPTADLLPRDEPLVATMDQVRVVCSTVSRLRKAASLRARQPLRAVTVFVDDPGALGPLSGLLADEVNVKEVTLRPTAEVDSAGLGIRQLLTIAPRVAGPRLGKQVQQVIKASKSGDWSVGDDGVVVAGGIALVEGEYALGVVAERAGEHEVVEALPGGGFVVLDTALDADLVQEGHVNDLVRTVQQARREAGLQVSDRISLTVAGDADTVAAVEAYERRIAADTLAVVVRTEPADALAVSVARVDG